MSAAPVVSEAAAAAAGTAPAAVDTIVQYIVLRKDLKWSQGALISQACHASLAATWLARDEPDTAAYLADMDNMHKVVLGAESEAAVREVAAKLTEAGITHKLWVEMPEGIVTCLATRPVARSILQPFFKPFKLLR